MKELVTETQADQIILVLSVLILVVSLALSAFFASKHRKSIAEKAKIWKLGFASACLGPLLWVLWIVYNAIENHYGLDSVKALLINAVLIVIIVGGGLGFLFSFLTRDTSRAKKPRRR